VGDSNVRVCFRFGERRTPFGVGKGLPPPLPLRLLRSSLRDEEWRQQDDAADAEDLVQETFVRAMERPPADTARP